ncbi:MAG TPA: hypothetical protein VEU33_46020 [Archangium sp.]|nr:hypothetical protein [Archangium sp.]
MKTLLAVLQLALVPPVPDPGSENPVSSPPSESKRVMTIDFEDDSIKLEPADSGLECYRVWRPLIRIREDFNDKVMKSVAEM